MNLRVVIADDERPARSYLTALLRGFDDVELVGEATNGAEAVTLIERQHPDRRSSISRCLSSTELRLSAF